MRLSSLKRIECIIPFTILAIAGTVKAGSSFNKGSVEGEAVLQITEKIYSNIFVRKREEHKLLVKHLLATEDYSKRYKLLKLALKEILKILQEDGAKLRQSAITAESVFPTDTVEMEALARYLENTCFFAELILHLPDISYRIVKTLDNWRSLIIASLSYSRSFVNILDQKSLELLGLLEQEIDESKRSDTYVNPYRLTADTSTSTPKPPKKKSKLKKGPQLSGTPRNEL